MNRTEVHLWDFPSTVILFLVLVATGQRLNNTHWAIGLGTATILSLIGVGLGLVLGFSRFRHGIVSWLTFGYSIPVVVLALGSNLYSGISWLERFASLSNRLADSIDLFIKNKPVQDTTLFVVFITLVFWIIGLFAGYAMARFGNFIGAVMPAGVVFVIIQLYDSGRGSNDTLLAVYFILALLFLGRLTFVQKRQLWKEQRVSILAESSTDLNIIITVVALACVFLVWLAPTSLKSFSNIKTAWEKFTHPMHDIEQNLGNAVAGLQGGGKPQPVEFFGDALSLGQKAAQGDTMFLQIRTPMANSTNRFYWRVRSYNFFLNDQWYAANGTRTLFYPDQAPIALANPEGSTGEFAFTGLTTDLIVLVTPARPVWVSVPAELSFLQAPQGKIDPIQFRSEAPVLAGDQYLVRAKVLEPTIHQLRNAGDIYPAWITDHYLQLPETLSPEIISLAQRITAHAKTSYDMAGAITRYLRSNITYASTVEQPPAGQDPMDWFLFSSKRGFCNYSASAEVILLRAAGIPARLAVGFAQGEFITPDLYVVRMRDSHAWPEAYFPGVGWVEFEPTTSQAPLERPLGENLGSAGLTPTIPPLGLDVIGPKNPVQAGEERSGSGQVELAVVIFRLVLIMVFVLLFFVILFQMVTFGTFNNILNADQHVSRRSLPGLVKEFLEKRSLTPPSWLTRWADRSELQPVAQSFMTIYRSLRWLSDKAAPSQTPAEAADVLAKHIPDASQEIYSLLEEYQLYLYSQQNGYLPKARRAEKTIRHETLRAAILQRWNAFRVLLRLGSF
jgi:transglutaminase-like putative cysteine protease